VNDEDADDDDDDDDGDDGEHTFIFDFFYNTTSHII
jgi:hypothetical protein